ncbi:hypothetical protein GCM10027615_36770 [Plantactinospora veratri]
MAKHSLSTSRPSSTNGTVGTVRKALSEFCGWIFDVIDVFSVADPVAVLLGEGVEDLSPGGDSAGDVLAGSSVSVTTR